MANEFNKYFSTIAKSIITKQNKLSSYTVDNTTPLHYLTQSFKNPFPNINLTLCRSNLKLYCVGRKAAFFSVGI